MTDDEIIEMSSKAGFNGLFSLIVFARMVAEREREACADLLMGLHEAQSNNDNHNYYHFASNAIKELRGKTITIKTKQYKCTGCQGKWHDSEDAKHHSCKDYQ